MNRISYLQASSYYFDCISKIRVNEALQEQGIQFDLSHLKPENLEELVNQLSDLTVDVDDHNTKVRVFCE